MRYPLRDWQADGVLAIHAAVRENPTGARVLASAPTGTGKGVIAVALQRSLAAEFGGPVAIVSPRVEILSGIANKAGVEATRPAELQELHLWTPIRLRNRLWKGTAPDYGGLILDEGHHATAESWEEILLSHLALPAVGLTATPFRGSPKQTLKLRDLFGEPLVLRSWTQAAEAGDLAVPHCRVAPLLDDDEVSIGSSGEFVAASAGEALKSRMEALAELIASDWDGRSSLLSVPTVAASREAETLLGHHGVPCVRVTQESTPTEREEAFARVQTETPGPVLVQVAVVSEGVDLPALRVWYDALPTLSPVRWLQALGRVTRPGSAPRVVCICRNLERHAYLLEGLVPRSAVAEAQDMFGGASKRLGARQLGLEALGRFRAIPVPLTDGVTATGFNLWAWDETSQRKREYFALASPTSGGILFAYRENEAKGEKEGGGKEWKWGRWKPCAPPSDLTGFSTMRRSWKTSEKQLKWWKRSARRHGLSADPPKEARSFTALPVLSDLGVRAE